MISYGRQDISESDIQAVVDVLRSDYLTQGPAVPAFEKAITDYCGAKYAVALNSATSALHLACLALDVGQGDVVWTSPITFVATANCALYCGAKVDFVDIDPQTYNIDLRHLKEKLTQAKKDGQLPKVVIPVHLAGQPCNMKEIHELSQQFGFKIIEDASHAIGGKYKEEQIGNCKYCDISIFSFHPVKIITTGEGGVATTNNLNLENSMRRLRSHGITRDETEMTHKSDGSWYYQQIDLGYNYRMTDMQAALGLSQMNRLDDFIKARHKIAARYDEAMSNFPLKLPWQHPDSYSGLHLYIVRLKLEDITKTHSQVFDGLREAGIGVNLHYIPVYLQPFYEQLGFKAGYCTESENYYAEAISLPMYPGLTELEQDKVIATLEALIVSKNTNRPEVL